MSPEEAQVTIQLVTPAAYNRAPLWLACDGERDVKFSSWDDGNGNIEVLAQALLKREKRNESWEVKWAKGGQICPSYSKKRKSSA